MSGIPRPVSDLPNGTVSVRLIRGSFSNNITDFPVELFVAGHPRSAKTDDAGRAEFSGLPAGATLKAVAVVDGERLESQEFPAPSEGGIRLMLVASATGGTVATTGPATPAVSGQVVIGSRSRIVLEPSETGVSVYYILDIVNNGQAPVAVSPDFAFDMPPGSVRTSLLEGSTPQAAVDEAHVRVSGPFPPGQTLVQVAAEIPFEGESLPLTQRFPAPLERLVVVVKKVGDTRLESAQLGAQQQMSASGESFIAATGGPVAAGQPVTLALTGLPHQSSVPRLVALSLAGLIIIAGAWVMGRGPDEDEREEERRQLTKRRDRLFAELVRLEHERRDGKVAASSYTARREELIAALEHVYGALDSEDMDPGPDRSVAA
jgi:hypothetical protein